MNLFITSIKRVTTTTPDMLLVRVGAGKDFENGYTSVEFDVEIKNIDFMSMSLKEIESLAISRAKQILAE